MLRQARIEELGQSMLRGARMRDDGTLGMVSLRRRRSDRTQDAYEEHFVLQDDRVAVLTDHAIVCLAAPGFAQLQAAAEQGGLQTAAPDVPAAELRWAVLWQVRQLVFEAPKISPFAVLACQSNPSL